MTQLGTWRAGGGLLITSCEDLHSFGKDKPTLELKGIHATIQDMHPKLTYCYLWNENVLCLIEKMMIRLELFFHFCEQNDIF